MGLCLVVWVEGYYGSYLWDFWRKRTKNPFQTRDSNFLNSIGNAQMMHELENNVLDIAKKESDTLEGKNGSESTMTEEEIRSYIHYVLNEVGKRKKAPI
jgi:hypothetical protein